MDKIILTRHKQPLDPLVPHSAGVAGQIHPLGEGIHPPQTRAQRTKLIFCEVCGLVDKNPVVFLPLILGKRRLILQMSEFNHRSVGKKYGALCGVVIGHQMPRGPSFRYRAAD